MRIIRFLKREMLRISFFSRKSKVQLVFLVLILTFMSVAASAADSGQQSANPLSQNAPSDTTQATQVGTIDLDKIVVTPSGADMLVRNSYSQVSVVDSKTIENSQSDTPDQLLENVPGVDVTRMTGMTSPVSTVSLRGFGSEVRGRTLVLIDGIPANSIYTGEVYWNSIPTEDIERIEVIPGASTALYGPGAMGGVINIITKNPQKLETELDTSYGTYDTHAYYLDQQNKIGNLGYIISGGYYKTDGYMVDPALSANPDSVFERKTDRENYNANLKLTYNFNDNDSVGMAYRHYYEYTNEGYQYYYGSKDTDDLSFNFKKAIDNIDILGTFYSKWQKTPQAYDNVMDNYAPYFLVSSDSIDYVNKESQEKLGGNLQSALHLSDSNILTGGIDWSWGESSSDDYYQSMVETQHYKGDETALGLYLQDEYKLLNEKLILTLGGRWDYWHSYDGYSCDSSALPQATNYDPRSSNAFSPKTGIVYHVTDETTLRASAGKVFRAPTLYDLYTTWTWPGWATYTSNPNLKPETAYSYEIGIDQTLWGKLLGRLTFYYNDATNLIYAVDTHSQNASFEEIYVNKNVAKATIYGLEPELKYNLTKEISFFANYTFDSSKIDKYIDPSLDHTRLTNAPENKSSWGLSWQNPKLVGIDITGRYRGSAFNYDGDEAKVKSNVLLDICLSRKINQNVSAYLRVDNLQNRRYQEILGTLEPGRTITCSAKVKF